MQYLIYKDHKRRLFFKKQEFIRYKYKFFLARPELNDFFKYNFIFKLIFLSNNSSLVFSNRCIFSYRSNGLVRFVKLSRLYFKFYVSKGFLRGILRSRH